MQLIEELKRRNVFRVGIAYAVASWLILQVADILVEAFAAPDWVMKLILAAILIGFPIALLFAWAFEVTPEGIKRESEVDRSQSITQQTGRRLDFAIIGVLVLALGYFVVDKFVLRPDGVMPAQLATKDSAPLPETAPTPGGDQAAPERSIAVLPFVNLSSDPEQEFFSDGISEELLNVLAQYPDLRVAARTSSFQFKGQNRDIGEIARLLKVKHILEGSVRKAGNQLRITAQLIEADNGYHLWSQTYDRELKDVFAIQDEISVAIGEALRVELALGGAADTQAPRVAETDNTAAYEAFLKGRALISKRGRTNITDGVAELERSVRLDNEYAPAHAWLAIGIALLENNPSSYGDYTMAQVEELARPHLEQALALDPDLAEAYGAMALLANGQRDWVAAIEASERAIELNPSFTDALNWGAIASQSYSDWEKVLELYERLLEIDPLSVVGRMNYVGWFTIREPERSEAVARSLFEQSEWAGNLAMAIVSWQSHNDLSEALRWSLKAYGESPLDDFSNRVTINLLSQLGETDEARRISDLSSYLVDTYELRYESVLDEMQRRLAADPDNGELKLRLANAYYHTGAWEMANRIYQDERVLIPSGIVVSGDDGPIAHARMVWSMVQLGALDEALAATELLREESARLEELNIAWVLEYQAHAILDMSQGDEARALESLRKAYEMGLRDISFLADPAFAALAQNPSFLAIRGEMQQELDREHAEMLQLVCFNNPIPETWEPLEKTCFGVEAGG